MKEIEGLVAEKRNGLWILGRGISENFSGSHAAAYGFTPKYTASGVPRSQDRVTVPAGVEIEGASPALSVPGVRSARKSMPAYGTLRHSRSMNTLSSQRPRRPCGWRPGGS